MQVDRKKPPQPPKGPQGPIMAENVNITPGAGETIAADQVADDPILGVGTAKVQFVKLMDGTIGGTSKQVIATDGSIPMGAIVNDTPESFINGVYHALSMTSDGSIRVSTVGSDIDHVWTFTLDSDPYETENLYV